MAQNNGWCGCIRGEYLCPEAERLWRQAGEAYQAVVRGGQWAVTAWTEYDRRRQAYALHMAKAEEVK